MCMDYDHSSPELNVKVIGSRVKDSKQGWSCGGSDLRPRSMTVCFLVLVVGPVS